MLEIAERAVGLAMVAQRGPARRHRLVENRANDAGQARCPRAWRAILAREASGGAARRQAGAMQGLADINIAKAGNQGLIEERSFERHCLPRKKPGQSRAVERVAERFYSNVVEEWMRGEFRTRDQLHEAEAARIVVNDARAGREIERDMIVRGIFRARTRACATGLVH